MELHNYYVYFKYIYAYNIAYILTYKTNKNRVSYGIRKQARFSNCKNTQRSKG